MGKKTLIFVLTHAVIVAFIVYHLLSVVNWYVALSNAPQLAILSAITLLIPQRLLKWYVAFLLYYFATTSVWFNNWIIALPNYLARQPLVFGALACACSLLSLYINVSVRKVLMVATFLSGLVLALLKSPLTLVLHLSLALTFLISLFTDTHFIVWTVNYFTYFKRRREGTL